MEHNNQASVREVRPDMSHSTKAWWKEASVYQIYPASFCDSDGDGIGDIPGIISKLDYIQGLGVDMVWVTPFFQSPQNDMGYDISDYRAIHPPYGTLADVEELIAQLHRRKMKFIADLVVNHTSDKHEWFQQSRLSRDNPYRDWYVWRDARLDTKGERKPPNNWSATWGGSVWEWDDLSQQYYLHMFHHTQPDLNWDNPDVVEAVHEVMEFWLEKGVDGFRMDVINFCAKATGYPDAAITNPHSEFQDPSSLCANGPRLHEHLQGLGRVLKKYNGFSVGEMPCAKDKASVVEVVKAEAEMLNMIFQFDIVDMDVGPRGKFSPKPWTLPTLKAITGGWQTFMQENDGWYAIFAENHDQARSVSRFATDDPKYRTHAAKLLATWLAGQCGTLYIYQGQELGMKNVPKEWPTTEYLDIESGNAWRDAQKDFGDDPEMLELTKAQLNLKARDNARTPMPWNTKTNAGFSAGKPWMKVNPDFDRCNAESQTPDPGSVYNYWRRLLELRKNFPDLLVYGKFTLIDPEHDTVFAYERSSHNLKALIVLNWSDHNVQWQAPHDTSLRGYKFLIGNYDTGDRVGEENKLSLRPWEAIVLVS